MFSFFENIFDFFVEIFQISIFPRKMKVEKKSDHFDVDFFYFWIFLSNSDKFLGGNTTYQ